MPQLCTDSAAHEMFSVALKNVIDNLTEYQQFENSLEL